jgi:hypothetical protein
MHRLLRKFLSQEGDDAQIVCAKRSVNGRESEIESFLAAAPYLGSGRLAFIDIGKTEMSLSSSALRAQRQDGVQSWSSATTVGIGKYIVDNGLYHSI